MWTVGHQLVQKTLTIFFFGIVINALINNFRVAYDYLIMGFPMCIEGRKYHRNALLWNLGLIIDKDARSDIYEPILRKLGYLLKNLEVS